MENVTSEKKQPLIKGLAVAGLLAIVLFSAWLAIQVVQVLPTAINSLASIANSVYNHNPLQSKNIEVSADKTLLQTNESISLSWPEQKNPGVFTFTYTCQDNISLSLDTTDKNIPLLNCDKEYDLGSSTSVNLRAKSDVKSIVDVAYKISFFRTNDQTPSAVHSGVLTIANPDLTPTVAVSPDQTPTPIATSSPTVEPIEEPVVVSEPEPVITKPVAIATTTVKTPVKVAGTPIQTVPTYIYKIPVSDPNGTIDLEVSYLGIGPKNPAKFYSKLNLIPLDTAGVLQFSVHNIGTKTSLPWSFTATLPGAVTYQSGSQNVLKPNERAVINIEFPAISNTGLTNSGVQVITTTDRNLSNNEFRTAVMVTK